jgi:hypothetical protein
MAQHIDNLGEQESFRTPLTGSVALHVGIVALAFAYTVFRGSSTVERWGDPKSLGGGAVGITAVERIPLPSRRGRINPVANDTESQVPSPPVKPQPKPVVREDPKPSRSRGRDAAEDGPKPQSLQKYNPVAQPKENQVYNRDGQAMTSPMFSQAPAEAVSAPAAPARLATASVTTSS